MKKYLLALLLATATAWAQETFTVVVTDGTTGYAPAIATVQFDLEWGPSSGDLAEGTITWGDGNTDVINELSDSGTFVFTWTATHEYLAASPDVYTILATVAGSDVSGVTATTTAGVYLVNPTEVPREIWYVVYPTLRQPWIDAPMELGSWMFQSSIIFRQPLHKGGVE